MTSKKLELKFPVSLPDGSIVRAVVVRAPTRDDLTWVRLECYARFTGLSRELIEEFDVSDLRALDEVIDSFTDQNWRALPR